MDAKGAFLLKAAGPLKTQSGNNFQEQEKNLSVREKAKLFESRLQNESVITGDKPKEHKHSNKVATLWPPEKPPLDGRDRVNLEEYDLSVKDVQSHFEGADNETGTTVNKQTNLPGRAPAWTPSAAPSSVQVEKPQKMSSAVVNNSSAGNTWNGRGKPTVVSVKDIIKRLQTDPDNNNPPSNELSKGEQNNPQTTFGERYSLNERECIIVQSDLQVDDLECSLSDKKSELNRNQSHGEGTTGGNTSYVNNQSKDNSTENYEESLDDAGEGDAGDLELTWRKETVLENTLRQAVTEMLQPPTIHCLYPTEDDDGLLLDHNPEPVSSCTLRSSEQLTLVDARLTTSVEPEEKSLDSVETKLHSEENVSEEQIFIPLEAATVSASATGCGPISDVDMTLSSEGMAVTSDLVLLNDTVIDVRRSNPNRESTDTELNAVEIERLNKIFDDLDAVLLAELMTSHNDVTVTQSDQLYERLNDLCLERDLIRMEHSQQKNQNELMLFNNISDSEKIIYQQEVENLNKRTADTLSNMRTVEEEEIKAILVNHQKQHRQIFTSQFLPIAQPHCAPTDAGTKGSHLVTSGMEPKPEVATVDVLGKMAEGEDAAPPSDGKEKIWMPEPGCVRAEDGLPSPGFSTSTTTATFRMPGAVPPGSSTSGGRDSLGESGTTGEVSVSDVRFTLPTGTTNGDGGSRVGISLPGSDITLSGDAGDYKNKDADSNILTNTAQTPGKLDTNTNDKNLNNNTACDTFISKPGVVDTHTFSRVAPALEDTEPITGTFMVRTDVSGTHTFSRVKLEEEESCSGSCSSENEGSSTELLSDGDEDDDLRRLQQRYGEILQWSDTERLSGTSDDDSSVDDSYEVAEDEQQNLEQSLKMTLTMDIKEKLPTLTEKDFSVMMTEYREVLKQAEQNRLSTTKDEFQTAPSRFTPDSASGEEEEEEEKEEDEDKGQCLETVKFMPNSEEQLENTETRDSGLGDNLCEDREPQSRDVATDMRRTLTDNEQTLKTIKNTCDASTSMGVDTLRACLSMASTPTVTSESATQMDALTSPVASRESMMTQTSSESEKLAEEKDPTGSAENSIPPQTNSYLESELLNISKHLEDSDRKFVDTILYSGHEHEPSTWQQLLVSHVETTESTRMRRQVDALRCSQKLKQPSLQIGTDSTEEISTQESEHSSIGGQISSSESQTTDIQVTMIGIQVEEDMLRLKEDVLHQLRSKDQESMNQKELARIFSQYRERQRDLVERRLSEKERATQKLQERLQKKRQLKQVREKTEPSTIDGRIRDLDDAFYSDLCERQRTQPITDHQLRTLVSDHVDKVENFRRKLEEEVARKRNEAIQKRLAQTVENPEDKARDANFANELVKREKENADMVKNVRVRERARFDEKLQAKLAARKRLKEQIGLKEVDAV